MLPDFVSLLDQAVVFLRSKFLEKDGFKLSPLDLKNQLMALSLPSKILLAIWALLLIAFVYYRVLVPIFDKRKARIYSKISENFRKKRDNSIDEFCNANPCPEASECDKILALSVADLAAAARKGTWTVEKILLAYIWKAVEVHQKLNCMTVPMFDEALEMAKSLDALPVKERSGVLFGVPVSLKDNIDVAGIPSSLGIIRLADVKMSKNAPIVDLLIAAGAVPFCKTNVPQTMRSFECSNPLWGATENPLKEGYTPGGSSGGESALVAAGGSPLGVGNDAAGSLRIPAHFCGLYTLKSSSMRIPFVGTSKIDPAILVVRAVNGPITRRLEDISPFMEACFGKENSSDVVPIPGGWKELSSKDKPKLKFGVAMWNRFMDATPACKRAVLQAGKALQAAGYEVIVFEFPFNFDEVVRLLYSAVGGDGGIFMKKCIGGEPVEEVIKPFFWILGMPSWIRRIFSLVSRVYSDRRPGIFLSSFQSQSMAQTKSLLAQRESLIKTLDDEWIKLGLDALITPPMATCALPANSFPHTSSASCYSFVWNIMDYCAGVIPVTTVDAELDKVDPSKFSKGGTDPLKSTRLLETEMEYFSDSSRTAGLPVGVQIITRRFQEAECLCAMKVVEEALAAAASSKSTES